MLQTITPMEMKQFETEAMSRLGISSQSLMQAAALHLADQAESLCSGRHGEILIACGCGNNGGDGLAAARILLNRHGDYTFRIFCLPGTKSADFIREMDALKTVADSRVQFDECLGAYSENTVLAIDALFGTGLKRPLEGCAAQAVGLLNRCRESGIPVLAVDIPSGIDGESGRILGCAVNASHTVSFHRPKPGLYIGSGIDHAGKVSIGDIGLNLPEALPFSPSGYAVMEKADLCRFLPERRQSLHKGQCGRVLLFAGSTGMAGAAALCATAALRNGAGLVTIACPEAVVPIVQCLCPCATACPLPPGSEAQTIATEAAVRFDTIAIGCGVGTSPWTAGIISALLQASKRAACPVILDADALNLLAEGSYTLPPDLKIFMTPHPAEAARLLHCATGEIIGDMVAAAKELRRKYQSNIILKGARSFMAAAEGMAINPFGTPAMAKGGSGDVLCGLLSALLAGQQTGLYTMNDLELMQCACAIHGLAGERAAVLRGCRSVLASDLCDCLGQVE